ncbi:ankyrin repeat domain-containing protein 39-like [Sitodiplosis mosellana]|uniref:ankyrin repeat domain-containing protein 39-like n=1 Tax=Sitodiplosis mosellana TaxID=263140 RepID=UPI0024451227|nr:ankyrin repeat domain-containing protein 39-like [Sitodiplosis mosellana]
MSVDDDRDKGFQISKNKTNELKNAIWRVKCLISEGMNMSIQYYFGETAMHLAAECGSVDIVELFLDDGVNPKILDSSRSTPLQQQCVDM